MELILYACCIAAAVTCAVVSRWQFFYLLMLPTFLAFLFVMRTSGFDTDVAKFAGWMTLSLEGWMLRELVYHLLAQTAYRITGTPEYAFLVLDALWLLLVLPSMKLRVEGADKYAASAIVLVSFAAVMGFENFYRQHIGVGFACIAFAFARERPVFSLLLFIAGLMSHNSVMLAFPPLILLTLNKFTGASRVFLSLGAIAMIPISLFVLSDYIDKSNASTGLNLSFVYVIFFACVFACVVVLNKMDLGASILNAPTVFCAIFILSALGVVLNDAPVERVGQLFLLLAIPEILNAGTFLEPRSRMLFRPCVALVVSLPMLAFSSTRNFLI